MDLKKRRLSTVVKDTDNDVNKKKKNVAIVESDDNDSSDDETTITNNHLEATAKPKRKSIILPNTTINDQSINNNNNNNPENHITNQVIGNRKKNVLTNQQISDLYSNCIKLSNENKINQKNTWNLDLIDNMDKVLTLDSSRDTTSFNFQAASCALEASAKIYSSRVDSVHIGTYKFLGGLSRNESSSSQKAQDDDNDEDENKELDENGDGDGDKKEGLKEKKKSNKKKSGVNTLETNLDNITIKKFDLQFMVDPLFGKTSAAFDEGGARGLLLNQLSIYDDCKLVFDSLDAIKSSSKSTGASLSSSTTTSLSTKTLDLSLWKSLFAPEKTKKLEICPTFSNFNEWSIKPTNAPEIDEHEELDKSIGGIDLDENDDHFENDINLNHNDDHSHDESDHNDNDNTNYFTDFNNNNDNNDEFDINQNNQTNNNINNRDDQDEDQGNIMKSNNADWEEFNFLPEIENWSGLGHWKFQKKSTTNKKATTSGEGGETQQNSEGEDIETTNSKTKRKATKKKAFFLDFDAEPPSDSEFEPPKKQTTVMSAAAMKKASETSTILPPDIHFDIKRLSRLFNKPQSVIPPMSKRDQFTKRKSLSTLSTSETNSTFNGGDNQGDNDTGFNVGPEYDFPSSQMLSSQFNESNINISTIGGGGGFGINDDDSDDNNGIGNDFDMDGDHFDSSNILNNSQEIQNDGNNTVMEIGINNGQLVSEPTKVNRIEISHNKFAKRINIESLSKSIWGLIDKYPDQKQQQQNQNQSLDESFDASIDKSIVVEEEPNTFKHLIQELKDSKQITPESSISLIFFCVLRLANEKNLKLNQTDINNFFISNTNITK